MGFRWPGVSVVIPHYNSPDSLARVVEAVRAQAERGWLSALAAKDERADIIGHYTCLHDDPGYVNTFLDHLAAVTAEQVQAAADRWLRPQSRAAVVYRVAQDQEEVA